MLQNIINKQNQTIFKALDKFAMLPYPINIIRRERNEKVSIVIKHSIYVRISQLW